MATTTSAATVLSLVPTAGYFSGRDGSTIADQSGAVFFGGHGDFVVASEPARLYSGRTGAILVLFVREGVSVRARSVAGVPDANGDGQQLMPLGSGVLCAGSGGAGTITAGATRNFQAWFRDLSPTGPVSNLSDAVTFSL